MPGNAGPCVQSPGEIRVHAALFFLAAVIVTRVIGSLGELDLHFP